MSGAISRGILSATIIFGVIFRAQSSRAQLPKGNFTRQQLSSEEIAGGGNNPGAIFLVEFSADVIVRWGGEGGVNCPGPIIRGAIIQRAIVQGVNYPGGGGGGAGAIFLGGNCPDTDTSHNKYILLQHDSILKILYFC